MTRNMVQVPGGTSRQQYQAPQMRLGRSQFDLSHNHKTTFDAGYLVPYFLTEVLPGDTMTCKLMSFLRIFSPLKTPIMDNIHVGIDFFYVPNRLVWNNWEAFLGAHDEAGAQDTDFTVPILGGGSPFAIGHLAPYMGIPVGLDPDSVEVNCLPFRAYTLCYDEWYRDQNLIDKVGISKGDGPDSVATAQAGALLKSAKKPDYFTTALPYLQKGDVQSVPLSGYAEIWTEAANGASVSVRQETVLKSLDSDGANVDVSTGGPGSDPSTTQLFADLSTVAEGFSINALRESAAIQRLLERDARGGTRITELTRAHWGVDVPDYRVQRPEYLGGGSGYINVSPVAQTSTEGSTENVGELAGIGTGTLRASWAKSFVEHGYVIGILRARGELSYHQGLDRMWSRSTRYDYPWPELAQLGEQPIYNKELFVSNSAATDDDVFGYQERYAEMRFKKSLITGKFAPDATGALDEWHVAEDFASVPSLNQTFIEDQTPMSRIQAVTDEPDFIIDGRFDFKVARALPVRPTPTLAPARF